MSTITSSSVAASPLALVRAGSVRKAAVSSLLTDRSWNMRWSLAVYSTPQAVCSIADAKEAVRPSSMGRATPFGTGMAVQWGWGVMHGRVFELRTACADGLP